jgi:hypothetical protein
MGQHCFDDEAEVSLVSVGIGLSAAGRTRRLYIFALSRVSKVLLNRMRKRGPLRVVHQDILMKKVTGTPSLVLTQLCLVVPQQ